MHNFLDGAAGNGFNILNGYWLLNDVLVIHVADTMADCWYSRPVMGDLEGGIEEYKCFASTRPDVLATLLVAAGGSNLGKKHGSERTRTSMIDSEFFATTLSWSTHPCLREATRLRYAGSAAFSSVQHKIGHQTCKVLPRITHILRISSSNRRVSRPIGLFIPSGGQCRWFGAVPSVVGI